MTISPTELALYAFALLILFLTPGPVWVALIARGVTGGFHAAWPLALGVVVGDVLWPLLAVLGVTYIVTIYGEFLVVLRYFAAVVFIVMGVALIRSADKVIGENSRLTAPGMWAGFAAGLLVILGNPKAILFYMGILPGFFDLSAITAWDIAAICFPVRPCPACRQSCAGAFRGSGPAVSGVAGRGAAHKPRRGWASHSRWRLHRRERRLSYVASTR